MGCQKQNASFYEWMAHAAITNFYISFDLASNHFYLFIAFVGMTSSQKPHINSPGLALNVFGEAVIIPNPA